MVKSTVVRYFIVAMDASWACSYFAYEWHFWLNHRNYDKILLRRLNLWSSLGFVWVYWTIYQWEYPKIVSNMKFGILTKSRIIRKRDVRDICLILCGSSSQNLHIAWVFHRNTAIQMWSDSLKILTISKWRNNKSNWCKQWLKSWFSQWMTGHWVELFAIY